MATPSPEQNQTVEEILAAIRQAISEEEAKPGGSRPAAVVPAPTIRKEVGSVGGLLSGDDADNDGDDTGSSLDDSDTQEVTGMAIEEAIEGVSAELGNGTDELDGDRPSAVRIGTRDRGAAQPQASAERGAEARPLPPRPLPPPRLSRPLLSARTGTAVSASFEDLARSMAGGNTSQLDPIVAGMLKPMLRTWLDDNLPTLVERLVREEIERVSRGRG